jgi:hypothetical protein
MKMRQTLWGVAALAVLATGCGSSSKSKRTPTSEEQGLEAKAAELEAKNSELEAQLRQKEAAIESAFAQATQAERSAGLGNLGCAGVTPASAPAAGMPRSGAQHAQVGLARKAFRMTPGFSGSRSERGWRISQGNCKVVSP